VARAADDPSGVGDVLGEGAAEVAAGSVGLLVGALVGSLDGALVRSGDGVLVGEGPPGRMLFPPPVFPGRVFGLGCFVFG
jgi:hypothetical protein